MIVLVSDETFKSFCFQSIAIFISLGVHRALCCDRVALPSQFPPLSLTLPINGKISHLFLRGAKLDTYMSLKTCTDTPDTHGLPAGAQRVLKFAALTAYVRIYRSITTLKR